MNTSLRQFIDEINVILDYAIVYVGIARAELELIFQTCTFIFIFRQFSFMQLQCGPKGNVCSLVKILSKLQLL